MALARAQYLEHVYRAVGQVLTRDPTLIQAWLPGLEDYVQTSPYRSGAERGEAIQTLLNKIWKDILGRPFNGHQMKHLFQATQDIPNIQEPLT